MTAEVGAYAAAARGEPDIDRQAEALAPDAITRNRIAKEKWGMLFADLYLHGTKSGEIVPAPGDLGFETRASSLEEFRKVSELLVINRRFSRPWDVNRTTWQRYSLSSLCGLEPDREPWWTTPAVQTLMADPAAAFAAAQGTDRDRLSRLITLENATLKVVIVPAIGGRIWRLYHKGTQKDLFWRGVVPAWALIRGLDAASYMNLGGYEEYAGEKFGSAGWAEPYQPQVAADGKSVTLTLALANGLRLTRTVTLAPDALALTVESRLENTGTQPVKGAMLRAHPQFALQPGAEKPELSVRAADGSLKPFAYAGGENFLAGEKRPQGAWAVRFPTSGLRVVNEFDPPQVGTCLFYSGPEFANVELFSPKQDLAPGASIVLKHRYVVGEAR